MTLIQAIDYAKLNGSHPDIIKYLEDYNALINNSMEEIRNDILKETYARWQSEQMAIIKRIREGEHNER